MRGSGAAVRFLPVPARRRQPSASPAKPKFFGAKPEGSELLTQNEGESLRLHPQDPLRGIFPAGDLLPVQLGDGDFLFPDVESIAGAEIQGVNDGGSSPGQGAKEGNEFTS